MRIDVHQHVWTEPLVEALERRDRLPFIRRERGLVMLHLAGERPCILDLQAESPQARRALVNQDGVDRALVCISSTIGIEALPRPDAQDVIEAYHEGALALGDGFGAWGAIALEALDPDDIDRAMDLGFAGLSLPAGALAEPGQLDEVAPALERAQRLDVPLLVHPGPAPWTRADSSSLLEPLWWPALTRYVDQMSAAWLTFVTSVRRDYPDLRAVFAMLAGGAPLLCERLEARSGCRPALDDPLVFYDTSSFGPQAIDAIGRLVGFGQLVYGSDRPVIDPRIGAQELELARNADRLLERMEVAA